MALMLAGVLGLSLLRLDADLGRAKAKPKFREILSKSRAINILSAARMFLFGARDVWFVVALPVFLATQFGWDHWRVGGFLALWVIGYGAVQAVAPRITGRTAGRSAAIAWAAALAALPALIALGLQWEWQPHVVLLGGLLLFGAVFAVNSSLHSFLIVRMARSDGVSLDVGFYYMANAMGRLIGTLLSGWLYMTGGLSATLWVSSAMLLATVAISLALPKEA